LPSKNGPFSNVLRSPQVYFIDVLQVRLFVNLCAVLHIEKIAHFQIGKFYSESLTGFKTIRSRLRARRDAVQKRSVHAVREHFNSRGNAAIGTWMSFYSRF